MRAEWRTRMLYVAVAIVLILLMGGGVALERYLATRQPAVLAGRCQTHLRLLANGMRMYSLDYDERLPPGERWTTCVDPYIQGSFLFGCPASRDLRWGYAMNRFLSSVPMRVIAEPAQTPLLFDSALGIPDALAHPDFAAARHPEGANVVYIDGRVGVAHSEP